VEKPQIDPEALSGIPKSECEQLLDKIQWLWVNRKMIQHHPLRHDLSGFFKRRKGRYRIIYSYDDISDEMIVHLAGTRDAIYQDAIQKLR
jgi:mRNA-degrading endonuclease RelE of RelBE toxin-antitoxin system